MPVAAPLHTGLVCVVEIDTAVGSVIVTDVEAVHPLVVPAASLTVTEYVPANSPLRSSEVEPLLQLYVYGAVPPLTVRSTVPVAAPLHTGLVCVVDTTTAVGSVIVTDVDDVQPSVLPAASLTVTEYVPAARPLRSWLVEPLLQEYV